ncbi:MAG: malto-oligosyltrehalose trehalohydrolase [Candidatus Velthaea sp.]
MSAPEHYTFGPTLGPEGVRFRLFAPGVRAVQVVVDDEECTMLPRRGGWFELLMPGAGAATRYAFRIDDAERLVPDPASRFQPDGVHGRSEVVDLTPLHGGEFPERPWAECVLYELHVGTFSESGTYRGAIERLDHLVDLGVTAVELMPLAQAPGARTWGYDGVLPYAPSNVYGTPAELAQFIGEAHHRRLAVFLDVVYNHFGPEGNYLHGYAPAFFTERYATPWGAAIDYSTDDVRAFFIENARYWLAEYGFDGLRLDATQMIFDERTPSVLEDLRASIDAWARERGRRVHLVVENDANDVRLLRAGYAAQWNDDFHHAVHVLATGERAGYYGDYAARPGWYLGRTLTEGFAYQGEPSAHHDGAVRGAPSVDFPLTAFVDFIQNHDQIGNRARGERLTMLAPPEAARAAAAVMLLAPSPPLLFMGEEWAASTPFLFFCDFEPQLARLVTEGRRREFAAFPEFADAQAREGIPDPSAPETFARCRLRWDERATGGHAAMLAHYRALLRVRSAEIAPRTGTVTGRDGRFVLSGGRGIRAAWALGSETLHADINLSPEPSAGFPDMLAGRSIFATHGEAYPGGVAPPWSVRWSIA